MLIKLNETVSVNPDHVAVSVIEIHDCTVRVEVRTVDGNRHVVHIPCKSVPLATQTKVNIESSLGIK